MYLCEMEKIASRLDLIEERLHAIEAHLGIMRVVDDCPEHGYLDRLNKVWFAPHCKPFPMFHSTTHSDSRHLVQVPPHIEEVD